LSWPAGLDRPPPSTVYRAFGSDWPGPAQADLTATISTIFNVPVDRLVENPRHG
jgi:hypothetical protein